MDYNDVLPYIDETYVYKLNSTGDRYRRGTTNQTVIQKDAVCCKRRSCSPVKQDKEIKCCTAFKITLGKPSSISDEERWLMHKLLEVK